MAAALQASKATLQLPGNNQDEPQEGTQTGLFATELERADFDKMAFLERKKASFEELRGETQAADADLASSKLAQHSDFKERFAESLDAQYRSESQDAEHAQEQESSEQTGNDLLAFLQAATTISTAVKSALRSGAEETSDAAESMLSRADNGAAIDAAAIQSNPPASLETSASANAISGSEKVAGDELPLTKTPPLVEKLLKSQQSSSEGTVLSTSDDKVTPVIAKSLSTASSAVSVDKQVSLTETSKQASELTAQTETSQLPVANSKLQGQAKVTEQLTVTKLARDDTALKAASGLTVAQNQVDETKTQGTAIASAKLEHNLNKLQAEFAALTPEQQKQVTSLLQQQLKQGEMNAQAVAAVEQLLTQAQAKLTISNVPTTKEQGADNTAQAFLNAKSEDVTEHSEQPALESDKLVDGGSATEKMPPVANGINKTASVLSNVERSEKAILTASDLNAATGANKAIATSAEMPKAAELTATPKAGGASSTVTGQVKSNRGGSLDKSADAITSDSHGLAENKAEDVAKPEKIQGVEEALLVGGKPLERGAIEQSQSQNRVTQFMQQLSELGATNSVQRQEQTLIAQADTAQLHQVQQHNQLSAQKAAQDPAMQQALQLARQDAVKELNERVSAMLNLNNKEAEIRLDPPELGSMQIRIRTDAEQAQVSFVVQNQQAKEALEQSLPRLREMLAEQGINLGESSVEQGSGGNAQNDEQSQGKGGAKLANSEGEAQNKESSPARTKTSSSAIDYYA
ncbi:flagellar hook-length control protein FliK [Pseudoalteromonas fenneropenaei]